MDVCRGLGSFHERVVDFQDDEACETVGGAACGCEYEFGLDVLPVGFLCQGLGGEVEREREVDAGMELRVYKGT